MGGSYEWSELEFHTQPENPRRDDLVDCSERSRLQIARPLKHGARVQRIEEISRHDELRPLDADRFCHAQIEIQEVWVPIVVDMGCGEGADTSVAAGACLENQRLDIALPRKDICADLDLRRQLVEPIRIELPARVIEEIPFTRAARARRNLSTVDLRPRQEATGGRIGSRRVLDRSRTVVVLCPTVER